MTSAFYARLTELHRAGRPVAIATVVRTQGSTPQVVGAKLIAVDDDRGRAAGTLGGGCVEADAILSAREVIQQGGRSLRAYDLSEDLAWNTGLVCGGTMWILAERADDALGVGEADVLDRLVQAAERRPAARDCHPAPSHRAAISRLRAARSSSVDGTRRGHSETRCARRPGRRGRHSTTAARHGAPGADRRRAAMSSIEPVIGRPHLVVAGGGHVALAIARQAQLLDFDVTILEDRPEFAQPERFDGATVIEGDVPAGDRLARLRLVQLHRHRHARPQAGRRLRAGRRRHAGAGTSACSAAGARPSSSPTCSASTALQTSVSAPSTPRSASISAAARPAEIALSVMAEITQISLSGDGSGVVGEALTDSEFRGSEVPRFRSSGVRFRSSEVPRFGFRSVQNLGTELRNSGTPEPRNPSR